MALTKTRRTQAERSAETRGRLLQATLDSLVEAGLAGTTTLAVCHRAGVSHGSLLHHYGTRERMLAAALAEVYDRLRTRVVEGLEALPPGEARLDALVDLMWNVFGAPEFKAVLELWLASANQPELGWQVRPEVAFFDAAIQPTADRLFPGVAERVPEFPVYVSLLFQLMQGMGLARAALGEDEEARANRRRVLDLIKSLLRNAFAEADARAEASDA